MVQVTPVKYTRLVYVFEMLLSELCFIFYPDEKIKNVILAYEKLELLLKLCHTCR